MSRRFKIVLASFALVSSVSLGSAEPLKTMDAVGKALLGCWSAPANTKGSSVTLSFSFKRDGTLIGPPKPTAIEATGDDDAKARYVDAATKALTACTPLTFDPALAEGIPGKVFTLRFASP